LRRPIRAGINPPLADKPRPYRRPANPFGRAGLQPSRLLKHPMNSPTQTRRLPGDRVRPGNLLREAPPRRGRTMNLAGVSGQGSAFSAAHCLTDPPVSHVGVGRHVDRPCRMSLGTQIGGAFQTTREQEVAPDALCFGDFPASRDTRLRRAGERFFNSLLAREGWRPRLPHPRPRRTSVR
jgi:hypothetical protein